MFNLHDFILKGLQDAVGKLEDYQIILNAAGWCDKGVLAASDLEIINEMIETKNTEVEQP